MRLDDILDPSIFSGYADLIRKKGFMIVGIIFIALIVLVINWWMNIR